jgi:TetR/AcrR family transcriptional regulator, cholesterol catabolism regulator
MSTPAQASPGSTPEPRQPRVLTVAALAESELGSEAQRERRKRILDATLAIASKGGYEAVQMRAVAERADVAVGTLYRYFPSKVHLLVSALGREFERIEAKTDRTAMAGTPYQRLHQMISRLNRAMQRNPLLTEAMTRAFVFADASAAGEVDGQHVRQGDERRRAHRGPVPHRPCDLRCLVVELARLAHATRVGDRCQQAAGPRRSPSDRGRGAP